MGPNLVVPRRPVEIPDGESFSVRGVSLDDALALYDRHAGDLAALYEQFIVPARNGKTTAPEDVVGLMQGALSAAPILVAEAIAIACDADPADIEGFATVVATLRKMPVGVQMSALNRIGELTFTSDMPPGKFLEAVISMARGASSLGESRPPVSGPGSGT